MRYMVSLDRTDGEPLLRVRGELDAATAHVLDDALGSLDARTDVVVALDRCSHLDKSALPVLVRHHRRFKGHLTVVADPRTHPGRLLQTTGLDRVLHVVPPQDQFEQHRNDAL
jgi:anti-anti-sigma factor